MSNKGKNRDDQKKGKDNNGKKKDIKASAPKPEGGLSAAMAAPEKLVGDGTPSVDYPRYRVEPGKPVRLSDLDPGESENYSSKEEVAEEVEKLRGRLAALQERLWAEGKQSLLVVLQAMDTGGKDGAIKHVFGGINPQGCQVWGFKAPSAEEAAHDFLWRIHDKTPGKGLITIFNRSHYEDVLIARVKNFVPEDVWKQRYGIINDFERALSQNNTVVLKFFLHISKDEQKRRLQSRLDSPEKLWKFAGGDIVERALWDDYMLAYQDAINLCSTEHAPWYVVPANNKWYRNLVIARAIADTLEAMNPQYPQPETDLDKVVIPD